jgi:OOP family OmpA-OmpF porin
MRAILTFVAVLVLGALPVAGHAADTPSADQIINSLTPTSGGVGLTRGIRLGGQPPPSAGPGTAEVKPALAAKPPEANLTVPFASGSAVISPAAAHVLDQLGEALKSPKLADFKFRVEGHTDTVGQPETNKALSEARAASVADYLTTRHGIDRSRLTPVGMGEDGLLIATGPQVPNSANRRVLVVNLGR